MKTIHLALLTLIGMYVATTALGAALFTTEFGRNQFQMFMGSDPLPFGWMTTLGSLLYWTLLLSLAAIAPVTAVIAERTAGHFFQERSAIDIPTWIPIAISASLVAWCIHQLTGAGALSAHELWDRSLTFDQKMVRRVELIALLGNRYYAIAYSCLPVLASFLLAKGLLQKDRVALGTFWMLSALLFWFDIAIVMKAPIIIYIGLVALTLILCGFGITRSLAVTVPLALIIYLALSQLQLSPTTPTTLSDETRSWSVIGGRILHITRGTMLRMASSFPYYVQTFSEPDERCGLQVPALYPHKSCFAPTKIFRLMYPKIDYVTGFAPAPANVSAYAELGLTYSFVATAICGGIIGLLAFFARGRDPLSVSIGVATCIYAYYVSQVSLIGSLLDAYGLFYLLLPPIAMIVIGKLLEHLVQATHRTDHHGDAPSGHAKQAR